MALQIGDSMEKKVSVEELLAKARKPAEDAMKLHPFYRGKVQVVPKCAIRSMDDFAIWYTPGVAEPCRDIHKNPERVFDSPISEGGFCGLSLGAAITGARPVIEIMYPDFSLVAADLLFNQIAKIRHMYGNQFDVPIVVRTRAAIGYGYGAQHCLEPAGLYAFYPGWRIVAPSTPYDAIGLLNTALQSNDPVLFVEHGSLYNNKGPIPENNLDYAIPFGKAKIVRQGKDITIFATSSMVSKTINVAEEYAKKGIEIEIIDPLTLVPLDKETLMSSVKKTGKLIVADEGHFTCGIGSEIAALVADEALEYLQAPIKRVASPDVPVPFSPPLEKFHIPDEQNLKDAIEDIMDYF